MIGTLKDTLTNVTKTFELSLTVKTIDNPVQKISSAKSEITENGDLTILLTGSNLPQEVTKYKFTYSGSETNVPTVDSTKLELDTTHNNTNTSVQFIIKKIKDTTPSAPSNYASPTTPPLPIAQTKGLYGKEFSVTLVDAASNPSSRVEEQPVTFTFADYVAPTSIKSSIFFENAESYKQKVNSSSQKGEDSKAISPQTTSEIEKDDCLKILELMRTPSFGDMLKSLTPKEAVITCLKLGYVDGKYFTTESIADFLGIETSEVIETTKKYTLRISYTDNNENECVIFNYKK